MSDSERKKGVEAEREPNFLLRPLRPGRLIEEVEKINAERALKASGWRDLDRALPSATTPPAFHRA